MFLKDQKISKYFKTLLEEFIFKNILRKTLELFSHVSFYPGKHKEKDDG